MTNSLTACANSSLSSFSHGIKNICGVNTYSKCTIGLIGDCCNQWQPTQHELHDRGASYFTVTVITMHACNYMEYTNLFAVRFDGSLDLQA